jgi:hypothetical protein
MSVCRAFSNNGIQGFPLLRNNGNSDRINARMTFGQYLKTLAQQWSRIAFLKDWPKTQQWPRITLVQQRPRDVACGRVVNTPASYSERPRFKSRVRDRLSWQRFSWFSSVHPGKCWDSTLKLDHDHFILHPLQFIIHLSPLHSTLYIRNQCFTNLRQSRTTSQAGGTQADQLCETPHTKKCMQHFSVH